MYTKDINKLKRQLKKSCDKAIDGIIDQMIANESAAIAHDGDMNIRIEALKAKIVFDLDMKLSNQTQTFRMYSQPTIDLK